MADSIKIQKLYSVNFFDLSPNFNTTVHNHSDWELLYVDSGEINCISDGENIFLKQGDVIFHHPNKTHSTVCNGKSSASVFNIHFVTDSNDIELLKNKQLSVSPRAAEILRRLIEECNTTYKVSELPMVMRENVPYGAEQMCIILLEEFLLLLIRNLENFKNVANERIDQDHPMPQIYEICGFMKDNVYGKLSLNDITAKFHFSKSFLCEQFKKIHGISPINYYLNLKLIEAKKLLRENDLTITEISEKLGFESPEYFSRYFKKNTGHSPRVFRKMLINDANLRKIK